MKAPHKGAFIYFSKNFIHYCKKYPHIGIGPFLIILYICIRQEDFHWKNKKNIK